MFSANESYLEERMLVSFVSDEWMILKNNSNISCFQQMRAT